MRNRTIVALLLMIAVGATVPASAGTVVAIDPVKTTVRNEQLPAAAITMSHTYFAWTQNAAGGFDHAFLETDGGAKVQIDTGEYGWVGGFADADPRLIYQRAATVGHVLNSNLVFFDTELGTTTSVPGGINTDVWQWSPSYDTDGSDLLWILYGENRFVRPTSLWRIKVWDEASGMRRTLAKGPRHCRCVLPGSIAFPFASWTNGRPGDAFVDDLRSDAVIRLVLPRDRDEHAVTVTSDGTAYVAQDAGKCGTRPKLYRIAPDGTPTLLASLPEGTEPTRMRTLDTGAGVDLYFDQITCSSRLYDIYVLRGADTATGLLRVEHVGSRGAATAGRSGRILPPGAMPPR